MLWVTVMNRLMGIPISNFYCVCFNFGFSFMEKTMLLDDVVGDGDEQINGNFNSFFFCFYFGFSFLENDNVVR